MTGAEVTRIAQKLVADMGYEAALQDVRRRIRYMQGAHPSYGAFWESVLLELLAARVVCHAMRHLSPTPELKASGRCPKLFERKDLP
jgi:hypothetical protein